MARAFHVWLVCAGVLVTPMLGRAQDIPEPQEKTSVESQAELPLEQLISETLQAIERLEAARSQDDRDARLEQVKQYLDRIEKHDPPSPWRSFLLARTYMAIGRPGDAIDQLQEFVQTREGRNEWRAYRMLGDLFVDQFPRLAKGNYEKAAELKPNEPSLLFGMSLTASKIGRSDEALQLARRAVEADGRSTVQYLSHLARLLGSQEKWAEAEAAAQAALELARKEMQEDPGSRSAIQAAEGQYALLIEILQRRLSNTDTPGLGNGGITPDQLADLYLRRADYIEQRTELAARVSRHTILQVLEAGVRRTEPEPPPRLLERYAIALAEVGRTQDAIAAFERLRAADPASQAASEWLQRLNAGPAPSSQSATDERD